MSPILTRITDLIARLRSQGVAEDQISAIVVQLIHGPLVAFAVALTPNKVDDQILAWLKAAFPLPTGTTTGAGSGTLTVTWPPQVK